MGKKSKPQTVTQTSSPWAPTQPYLKGVLSEAEGLYQGNKSPEFYAGQTYAQSPHTRAAVDMMADRAQQPGLLQDAQTAYSGVLNQDMSAMSDAVRAEIMPHINSQFSSAGRDGSGAHAESLAKGFSRGMAPYMLQKNNQTLHAAQMAPEMANMDTAALYKAGLLDEGLEQRGIDESMARHDFSQNAPWMQLGRYSDIVRGQAGLGGTSTGVTTRPQKSPWQTALGAGLGIASMFPGIGAPAQLALGASGGLLA